MKNFWIQNKFWVNIFLGGQNKILGPNIFGPNEILCTKKIWIRKKIGSEKILVQGL